ncbi:inositol monophosphatase family protein [Actinomyces gaoshouyii]|uniref:inositol monophosphatase family protein n=1 Tax=Actinomyces gaoshouyii TaxID=1960083 RepID=UPI0009BDC6F2|nr:inositol monophosphatase [Actinomyces gaoshouyii]ARD41560.1 inositol monophosphatase [Actinomyces gaoshouyii]
MSTRGLDLDLLLGTAREAVLAAAAFALDPGAELRVETKQHDKDLVTQVDRGAERIIAECLAPTAIPLHGEEEHRVEGFEERTGPAWVVDPIDGTTNYVATHRDWAVSLALVDGGAPVIAALADPVAGRLMTAIAGRGARVGPLRAAGDGRDDEPIPMAPDLALERGAAIVPFNSLRGVPGADGVVSAALAARAYGSAALEIAEVARGGAVAFLHGGLKPWDMAAAVLLAQETGALVTRVDGSALDARRAGSVLAATPTAHARILELLAQARDAENGTGDPAPWV